MACRQVEVPALHTEVLALPYWDDKGHLQHVGVAVLGAGIVGVPLLQCQGDDWHW